MRRAGIPNPSVKAFRIRASRPVFSLEQKPFILATIAEGMSNVVKTYIDQDQSGNQEWKL